MHYVIVSVIVFLALTQSVVAGADKAESTLPMTGERSVEFETREGTWMSLDVAPDGQSLVFDLLGDLYRLPMSGGEAVPLTTGMAFDSQPRFSPDGARLVFVSDRDGSEAIWTMAVDGSDFKKVTEGGAMIEFASPSYAPDGSHILASRTSWGLGTFELWAYHLDGGKGLRITNAKSTADVPRAQRHNALGAAYTADGRYLYYAKKLGGFAYNLNFPQWQIARRELITGDEDVITQAVGSAFRPALSADGRWLVYATRHAQKTGLRKRDLNTGEDTWLAYPVEHDEQESRFTRDLLPGYAITRESDAVLLSVDGGIVRIALEDGTASEIEFTAKVVQQLGPKLYFPYRLGLGPVKARLLMGSVLSPDGQQLAFTAFNRLHSYDIRSGKVRVVSPEGMSAFHPAWSADGNQLAFVSWSSNGGQLWRINASGRGRPVQVSRTKAFYTDPAFSPDGSRLLALRATSYDRLYPEFDDGAALGADLVWFPSTGGEAQLIVPARGLSQPHFGPEDDRVYVYFGDGGVGGGGGSGLVSVRFDGSDRRTHLTAKGPGVYAAEENVPASDIRVSPDGRQALVLHANQLYVVSLLNRHLLNVEVTLDGPAVPLARITDVGADYFGWSQSGEDIFWTVGNQFYRRPLHSVVFERISDKTPNANADGPKAIGEEQEAVFSAAINLYLPRHQPEGVIALVGATVLPMEGDDDRIEQGVVIVENDRIKAVGSRATVSIPAGARVMDLSGKFLVPGFVDTHAHYRPLRRVLDTDNWAFLANLAYGVTTGLDVQPSTPDILAYQDLIEAGLMLGPRALSTGPGIFSNNNFQSGEHARSVLRRYKDHYGVRNLKAYLSGDRKQRQWVAQASHALKLMPTTEGGLDMKLDLTHVIDGFSGNEHNFPLMNLYGDSVRLIAESGIAYTPTLLVAFGGPAAENWFYTRESPHHDVKLRRFTPGNLIDVRTQRTRWFLEEEFSFPQVAQQAAKIMRAGGRVGVGAHGQLQGLGYHWEMRALSMGGFTPREILTAATRQGAEMIGVAEDIGTISEGKLADMVVLTADPTQDIRNSSAIEYVMKNGEMFEGDSLDQIWPEQRPLPEQWWWNSDPAQ